MSSPELVYIQTAAGCAGTEVDGSAEIGPLLSPGSTAFCCAALIISDPVWKITCRYCEKHILKHHL